MITISISYILWIKTFYDQQFENVEVDSNVTDDEVIDLTEDCEAPIIAISFFIWWHI